MFKLFTLLLQLPILVVLALPTTGGDSNVAKITEYGINGSGCAPGTFTTELADGGTSIVASFSKFAPQVSAADFRQNCQATLEVTVPAKKQFTLTGVEYSGYVQVTSKVAVTHESLYYFQGELDQKMSSSVIWGPMTGHKDLSNSFKDGAIWSACGGKSIINVDIALILNSEKGDGYTTVDGAKIGPFAVRDC